MRHHRIFLLFLLALLFSACASTRSGSALYRRDVGVATAGDALTLAEQVINRYGFQIDQADTEPDIRLLTRWRPRTPFRDEQVLGITAAESRILIVARLRTHTELGPLYAVNLTIENRVQVAGSTDWNELLNTDMFREFANEIYNDYRQLVANIGVRRF